jgi:hypothetical protein
MADKKKAAKKTAAKKPDGEKADKKIIAVVGATGAQGGGLARAILNDKHSGFAVRALTRDPNSDKAKALADAGAEVMAADVDNEKSLPGIRGCSWRVLCHFLLGSPQRRRSRPATGAGGEGSRLRHVIWSTPRHTIPCPKSHADAGREVQGRTSIAKTKPTPFTSSACRRRSS